MNNTMTHALSRTVAVAAAVSLGLLAACTAESEAGESENDTVAQATAAETVTVVDAWAVATDEEMTAVFGVLENGAGTEARIVGADSDRSRVELHEVAESEGDMVMQEVPEGFAVPAEGEHELLPGGDHLMLMELAEPLLAGDRITVTLVFDDGSELAFEVTAKDFAGGDEEYEPHGDHDAHDTHDM